MANLIKNPEFEDPIRSDPNQWYGGTRTNTDKFSGSYSLAVTAPSSGPCCFQIINKVSDNLYHVSLKFKPIAGQYDLVVAIEDYASAGWWDQICRMANDTITEQRGISNAKISILSNGWRNVSFIITLQSTDKTFLFEVYYFTGFLDDAYLGTSPPPLSPPPPSGNTGTIAAILILTAVAGAGAAVAGWHLKKRRK